jgi:hypothetical protein
LFQIAAVPFNDFDTLDVPDGPRWLLVRLARYADREGRCFPSMRTLAAGARKGPVANFLRPVWALREKAVDITSGC